MTGRLYYDDSYTVDFTARIIEQTTVENQPAVVFDHTYFYPASGGQPADSGTINGVAVVDVLSREEDAAVLHVLAEPVTDENVTCKIDWARRFDHMQHHTGQHILTQAFVQVADAHTVSFHLSPDSVTIDLDTVNLTPETVAQVEELANRVIYENRSVTAHIVNPDETENVRIRKLPDHLLTDGLRVIEVEAFDQTACGGTHVRRTGEIGMIKVIKLEKRGDKTRVEFRCGGRALRDYGDKHTIVSRTAAELTCGYDEIPDAVVRLRDDLKQAHRSLKAQQSQLADYEIEHLLLHAAEHNGLHIVKAAFDDRDVKALRALINRLIETPRTLVLMATGGEKAQVMLARSGDVTVDMNALLQRVLPILGDARGGGRPDFAQGGGVKADMVQVQSLLDEAERVIRAEE